MTGCIYHEADLDGVMSAAIVKGVPIRDEGILRS